MFSMLIQVSGYGEFWFTSNDLATAQNGSPVSLAPRDGGDSVTVPVEDALVAYKLTVKLAAAKALRVTSQ